MRRSWKFPFFFGIFGLAFFVTAFPAQAETPEVWYLDQGFLGRPVDLDILGGKARLAWQAGDVLYPSDVTVAASSGEISIRWSTSYALADRGVEIGLSPEWAATTTSGTWQELAVEVRMPFGKWRRVESAMRKGFVTARIGAEAQVRLSWVPRGMRSGTATWYRHKGCNCAASPDFPKGTKLKVSLKDDPAKSVVVTVNDWGPDRGLFPSRVIDLDSVAFKRLAPLSRGKVQVSVEPLGAPQAALSLKR